jgi:hypothetical protein
MEPKMNEEELKRRTKKRRDVSEEAWTYLRDRGYVEEALELPFDDHDQPVEYIIKEVDALAAASPGGGARRTQAIRSNRGPETVQVSLGASELARQGALEEYFAMCAACDFDVYRFRKKVLGEQLLSKDQAWDLLKSPAAALVETRFFESWGIPIVGHTAEVKSYESDLLPWGRRHVATLTIDPPGITREVSMSPLPAGPHQHERRPLVLKFPDGESGVANHEVWSVSLLGELREVGEKLHKRYRWHPAEAVWFVLTGETPAVPALTVTRYFPSSMHHHPDRDVLITIEASPWISSRSVARAFHEAQIKTLGSGAGSSAGEKNLTLLRFVIERTDPLGMLEAGSRIPKTPEKGKPTELELIINLQYVKVPGGKELVKEWNELNPQWSYGGDTRRFWRDFNRIRKSVAIGPPYAPNGDVQ